MALASTIAGMAFSAAGVHVPHALAYPIASLKHEWQPPGYGGAALIPHGFAVAVTAPAVFRFIEDAVPERCATAARLLDGGDDLAVSLERLLADVGAPLRLRELGYGEDDRAAVVQGALDQQRLLVGLAEGDRRRRSSRRCSRRRCERPLAGARRDRRRRNDGRRDRAGLRLERHPDRSRRQHARSGARLRGARRRAPLPARGGRARRRGRGRDGAEANLSAAASIEEAVDGADLIVEAVVERPDVKATVYAAIESAAGDGAVIATNTSSIPISELAAGLRRPARFLGMHWFVPPLLVPCVEVIPAPATAEQVVRRSWER